MQQYTEFEFELAKLFEKYQITEMILITRHEKKVHHTIGSGLNEQSEDFRIMSNMLRQLGKTGKALEKNTLFFPKKI